LGGQYGVFGGEAMDQTSVHADESVFENANVSHNGLSTMHGVVTRPGVSGDFLV
jgi:hypothetical protein